MHREYSCSVMELQEVLNEAAKVVDANGENWREGKGEGGKEREGERWREGRKRVGVEEREGMREGSPLHSPIQSD